LTWKSGFGWIVIDRWNFGWVCFDCWPLTLIDWRWWSRKTRVGSGVARKKRSC